jgi:alkaline phosphatase
MSTFTSAGRRRALPVGVAVALVGGAVVLLPSGALAGGNGSGHGGSHHADSVIFINGDGMAAAHREAARLDQAGFDGDLVMDSLPVAGLQTTDPRDPDDTVTDSAAAATAWATGQKTFNGAISVDVEGNPVTPLGTEAKRAGKATGLVTTAQVTDATPAAFFSSVEDRGEQSEIARQYLEVSKPDVILGGGEDRWLPTGDEGAFPPRTGDTEDPEISTAPSDLVAEAQDLGYEYVNSADGLAAAEGDRLLGLFANEEMFQQRPEGEGDEYSPVVPLADMTTQALDVLDESRDGFFLLIEEEAVDEMSHENNATRMLQAMRALEDAVQVARDYVAQHPDTLLIVTGDHECGGLTVEDVDDQDESGDGSTISAEDGPFPVADSEKEFVLDWTTTGHTGAPTVVTAEGEGSEALEGYYPNTHLHEVMRSALVG